MNERNFDVVIYGATGFTGKLVVEYMLNQYGNDNSISWAMAGRSHEKLIAVRDKLGVSDQVPLLIVDSNDKSSVTEMVKQTKCVLTTVGPYQLYGNDIVAECAALGTDYVDLCGEPGWMHEQTIRVSISNEESHIHITAAGGVETRMREEKATLLC